VVQKRLEKRKQELQVAALDPKQRKLIFSGRSIELQNYCRGRLAALSSWTVQWLQTKA